MKKKIVYIFVLMLILVGCVQKDDKFKEYQEGMYLPKKWEWQEKSTGFGDYYSDLEDIIMITE